MAAWCDFCCNLSQVQVHGFGVAGGQDEGSTLSISGADGAEDVGRGGAEGLVPRLAQRLVILFF